MADVSFVIEVDDNGTPKIKKFGESMKDAESKAKGFSSGLSLASGAMSALGGLIAVGAIAKFAKDTIDAHDAAKQFGMTVGVSTKNVVGFNYAAEQAGSNAEVMQQSMTKLADKLGSGEANKALSELGISAVDSTGKLKSVDAVLLDVAGAFEKMADGPEKTAAAIDIFGKSGAKLIPTLNSGRDALAEMVEQGASLENVSENNVAAMESFNDAMANVESIGRGAVAFLIESLTPAIKVLGEEISQLSKEWAQFWKEQSMAAEIDETIKFMDAQGKAAELRTKIRDLEKKRKAEDDYDAVKRYDAALDVERRNLEEQLKIVNEYTKKKKDAADKAAEEARRLEEARTTRKPTSKPKSDAISAELDARLDFVARWEEAQKKVFEAPGEELDRIKETEARLFEQEEKAREREQFVYDWKETKRQEEEEEKAKAYELELKQNEERRIQAEEFHAEEMRRIEEENYARAEALSSSLSNGQRVIQNFRSMEEDRINAQYDKEAERAQGNEALLKQIEANREKDVAAARKRAFAAEKAMATAEAVINTSVAFTKALASAPPPFGEILAASVAALGATQIAMIQSQKFALGGEPIGRNALVTANENGQEVVLNAGAYKTIGREFAAAANAGATEEQLAAMIGGKRGSSVTINLSGFIDSPATANYLAKQIIKQMGRNR